MKRVLRAQSDFRSTTLRNQLTSLVLYEAITTTAANAKYLIPFADHFFNQVKPRSLAGKKIAHQTLVDSSAIKKLFEEVLPRYQAQETTFVRQYKVVARRGDNAPMVTVALLHPLSIEPVTSKTTKAATS